MFTHISALLIVVVAVVASARMERHVLARRNNTVDQCNAGTLSCCNSVANSSGIKPLLDALSLQYEETDNFGLNCIPIVLDGAGESASCQQQPVCCTGDSYYGMVNIGCSPLDFNL